jgi:hypothetical protein
LAAILATAVVVTDRRRSKHSEFSETGAGIMSGIGRLDHACQTGRHSHTERGLDLYETPEPAVVALLRVETLPLRIWEPAAGRGAIARILRAHGHTVIASDVDDHGFPLDFASDFLTTTLPPKGCGAIVTNPPYQFAEQFVAHALELCPRVIMLLRLAFLESERRSYSIATLRPSL